MKIRTRFRSAFSVTAFAAMAASSVVHAELPQASTPIHRVIQPVAASGDASTSPARVAGRSAQAESRLTPLSSPIAPVPPAAFGDQKPAVTKSAATPSNLPPVLLASEPSMISRLTRLAQRLPESVPLMDSTDVASQTETNSPRRRRTLDHVIRASGWAGWSGGVIGRAVRPVRKPGDPDPEVDPLPPLATPPTGLDADAPLEP